MQGITNTLELGVCYYPEHWPQELWEDDFRRMKECGISIVRMAEFAWNLLEPKEGRFNIAWFDQAMDLAHRYGLRVILGTPTATPPAWLTHKYPEVLNADKAGHPVHHGMRRHYNYNSQKYRELCARIVQRMAEHYATHPALAGWQIDNELNCEIDEFHSEADHAAFRDFLRAKYKDLDALNATWGTNFWSQTYTDWAQVFLPRTSTHDSANPHLLLDEKRFISASVLSFCKLQADILKKSLRDGQFITTNGLFSNMDNHLMTEESLDFITFDSYPNFSFNNDADPRNDLWLNDRASSQRLSQTRSISPHFGVMEQQSGAGSWTFRMMGPMPKPGQLRLWAMQSFAHGADFVSFFRWRTAAYGTEIYWHGLNNYDNRPNRRLEELAVLRGQLDKIGHLAGAKYVANAALAFDYDNEWDGRHDAWHGPLRSMSEKGWYTAAQCAHVPMDIVKIGVDTTANDLSEYKLLVYPHAAILSTETAAMLKAYVENGGTLVLGARTGYKDEDGHCPMLPMPGPIADLCGATVSDYTFLGPADDMEYAVWDGEKVEAAVFNDILSPTDGEVLATFCGNYYDGKPALVRKKTGKGCVYYFGAGFTRQAAAAFLAQLGIASPAAEVLALPEEIELAVREKNGKSYYFLLNYAAEAQEYTTLAPMSDMLTGKAVHGKATLAPYGVAVLTQ